MKQSENCKLTVEIPKNLHQTLKIECALNNITIKEIITKSVYKYLEDKNEKADSDMSTLTHASK